MPTAARYHASYARPVMPRRLVLACILGAGRARCPGALLLAATASGAGRSQPLPESGHRARKRLICNIRIKQQQSGQSRRLHHSDGNTRILTDRLMESPGPGHGHRGFLVQRNHEFGGIVIVCSCPKGAIPATVQYQHSTTGTFLQSIEEWPLHRRFRSFKGFVVRPTRWWVKFATSFHPLPCKVQPSAIVSVGSLTCARLVTLATDKRHGFRAGLFLWVCPPPPCVCVLWVCARACARNDRTKLYPFVCPGKPSYGDVDGPTLAPPQRRFSLGCQHLPPPSKLRLPPYRAGTSSNYSALAPARKNLERR